MSSKLLLDEYPLIVLPSLACAIGLPPAIFLQQVHYWCRLNESKGSLRHYHNGRWWCWNTAEGWVTNMPFWSVSTIKRIIKRLRDNDLILTANYNLKGYDRTNWFSIDYDALDEYLDSIPDPTVPPEGPTDQLPLPIAPLPETHGPVDRVKMTRSIVSKRTDPLGQNDPMDGVNLTPPIPETIQRLPEESIWSLCTNELRLTLTHATYDTWIHPLSATITQDHATIHCPNSYVLDWCQHRLSKTIDRKLRAITDNPELTVTYALAPCPTS